MCDEENNPNFEFRLASKSPKVNVPLCDKCGGKIDLEVPESYDKVYWRCFGGDLYTHIDCF